MKNHATHHKDIADILGSVHDRDRDSRFFRKMAFLCEKFAQNHTKCTIFAFFCDVSKK